MSQWTPISFALMGVGVGYLIGYLHGFHEACQMYRKHCEKINSIWEGHMKSMEAIWRR